MSYNELDHKKQIYWSDPDRSRAEARAKYEASLSPDELSALQEKRRKRAEYKKAYYAAHPEAKAKENAKHRTRYIDKIRARDRWRNSTPERRAMTIEAQRKRKLLNPEAHKEYAKEYYRKNKQKWAVKNSTPARREYMKKYGRTYVIRGHGITVDQYNAMFDEQCGLCAICHQPPVHGKYKRLHIDHDHSTGKVRGLLCMKCNHAIERLDSYEGWADRAKEYLKRGTV